MTRVALLLLALPALCAAQADAPVPIPEVKPGDWWVYQRMDYDDDKPRGRYEMRVVFSGRGVIQVVNTQGDHDKEVDVTFTSEWNGVSMQGRVFYPHTGLLKFPLQVGASYKSVYEVVQTKSRASSKDEKEVKVVGWENITVPAGKFRALKIVAEGTFRRLDSPNSGSSRNVIWYVPEVKRWVKMISEIRPIGQGRGRGGGSRGEHVGEELVDFNVQ